MTSYQTNPRYLNEQTLDLLLQTITNNPDQHWNNILKSLSDKATRTDINTQIDSARKKVAPTQQLIKIEEIGSLDRHLNVTPHGIVNTKYPKPFVLTDESLAVAFAGRAFAMRSLALTCDKTMQLQVSELSEIVTEENAQAHVPKKSFRVHVSKWGLKDEKEQQAINQILNKSHDTAISYLPGENDALFVKYYLEQERKRQHLFQSATDVPAQASFENPTPLQTIVPILSVETVRPLIALSGQMTQTGKKPLLQDDSFTPNARFYLKAFLHQAEHGEFSIDLMYNTVEDSLGVTKANRARAYNTVNELLDLGYAKRVPSKDSRPHYKLIAPLTNDENALADYLSLYYSADPNMTGRVEKLSKKLAAEQSALKPRLDFTQKKNSVIRPSQRLMPFIKDLTQLNNGQNEHITVKSMTGFTMTLGKDVLQLPCQVKQIVFDQANGSSLSILQFDKQNPIVVIANTQSSQQTVSPDQTSFNRIAVQMTAQRVNAHTSLDALFHYQPLSGQRYSTNWQDPAPLLQPLLKNIKPICPKS